MNAEQARDIMTKSLISVRWSYPLDSAEELMAEERIRHLPIMGDSGDIVGILSDRDVLRGLNSERPGYVSDEIVGTHMSWPVLTVSEDTPILDIVEGMIDNKISAYLVMRKSECLGIITSEDMLYYLSTRLKSEDEEDVVVADIRYSPLIRSLSNSLMNVGI